MNLGQACEEGDIERVKELLKEGTDPNHAIRLASYYGNEDIVKMLLRDGLVDPTGARNFAIRMACCNGYTKVVEVLLEDKCVDPADDNNFAIEWASNRGHLDVIKLLLQDGRVEPTKYAIEGAKTEEIRELLLKYKYRVDGPEYCRLKNEIKS